MRGTEIAASFRRALEDRLRSEAQDSGVPLNRLRKEAAFNRLLARLRAVAPEGWALKGGLALIARVGARAGDQGRGCQLARDPRPVG